MKGVVTAFDEHRGIGSVELAEGGSLFFHCTAIADGSRTIEVGASVTFDVVPGHLGRYEASSLERDASVT
jgi:cold shock CspA family protein